MTQSLRSSLRHYKSLCSWIRMLPTGSRPLWEEALCQLAHQSVIASSFDLRSVFRESVEKNPNVCGDDTDAEYVVKNQAQLGSGEDGYAEIFCDGTYRQYPIRRWRWHTVAGTRIALSFAIAQDTLAPGRPASMHLSPWHIFARLIDRQDSM